MAIRARLVAPPPKPTQIWPWHVLKHASVRAKQLFAGDRRMEAETYLSRGFSLREAIESRPTGWKSFGDLARVEQPGRLKGILVSQEYGTPFLSATQVFDIRPIPRKFLALEKMETAKDCFVGDGTILVTRSGSVGRSTLAHAPHRGVVISDDLLRVYAKNKRDYGWLYAYLHAPQVRAMTIGAHYGHIIKHLETFHLEALPIPVMDDATAAYFSHRFDRILYLRNEAHKLAEEADLQFAKTVGSVKPSDKEEGFVTRASTMSVGRRRLEACFHTPRAAAIFKRFKHFVRVGDVTERVWWMTRFRRFYGEDGIPYLSADELFTANAPEKKRILVDPEDDYHDYFVKSGWIVMACSGQVYGLNGAAALMTKYHENIFFSHDLIRIIANPSKIRAGYLLVALTHRTHGRPLLIRTAYGTSIPHLDPNDVMDFPVIRLDEGVESSIANLAEADVLEREIAQDAAKIIDRFIAGCGKSHRAQGNTPPLKGASSV